MNDVTTDRFVRVALRAAVSCAAKPIFAAVCDELRRRCPDRNALGRAWEALCVRYLIDERQMEWVGRPADMDEEARAAIGLGCARDVGIDLVARRGTQWVAVQCKFRSRGSVTWRELATFDALCGRSGPWHGCWVMTNTNASRRAGAPLPTDTCVGEQTWKTLDRAAWNRMAGCGEGCTLGGATCLDAREGRTEWLDRIEGANACTRRR
jgi:hypothetical protein